FVGQRIQSAVNARYQWTWSVPVDRGARSMRHEIQIDVQLASDQVAAFQASAHPGSDEPVDDLPLTGLGRIVRARCSSDVVLPQHFCIEIDVDREAEDALVLVVFNAKAADFADMNAVQVHGRACGQ